MELDSCNAQGLWKEKAVEDWFRIEIQCRSVALMVYFDLEGEAADSKAASRSKGCCELDQRL